MNWDAIGAIGEIVGALAVVLSLIYLATQVRQNNKLLVMEARTQETEQVFKLTDMALEDDSLIELMLKDCDQLSEVERARLLLMGRRFLTAIDAGWNNSPNYELNNSIYHTIFNRPGMNYGMPDVWPEFKDSLSPDFVTWFEQNVIAGND